MTELVLKILVLMAQIHWFFPNMSCVDEFSFVNSKPTGDEF